MRKNTRRAFTATLLAGFALTMTAACSDQTDDVQDMTTQERVDSTLIDVLGYAEGRDTLAAAIEDTGLATMLEGEGSYTLLAPGDAAFEALGEGAALLEDEAQGALVAALLREHLVPGALTPEAIREAIAAKGGPVTMRTLGAGTVTFALEGEALAVTNEEDGKTARIDDAAVVAGNGVLLPVDALLAALPETAG